MRYNVQSTHKEHFLAETLLFLQKRALFAEILLNLHRFALLVLKCEESRTLTLFSQNRCGKAGICTIACVKHHELCGTTVYKLCSIFFRDGATFARNSATFLTKPCLFDLRGGKSVNKLLTMPSDFDFCVSVISHSRSSR